MADSEHDRLEQIREEESGGVSPVMWAGLAALAAITLTVIFLSSPRNPEVALLQPPGVTGSAETTGTASSEPNDEIERRWPAAMDDVR